MSDESDAFASADEGVLFSPQNVQIPSCNQKLSVTTELSNKSTSKLESIVKEPGSSLTAKANTSTKKKRKVKKTKKSIETESKNVHIKSDQSKSKMGDIKVEQIVDQTNGNKDVLNNLDIEEEVTQKLIGKNSNANSNVEQTAEELSKSEHHLFVSESQIPITKDTSVIPEISVPLNEPQKLCDADFNSSASEIVSATNSTEKSNFLLFNNSDIIKIEGKDSENDVSNIRSVFESVNSSNCNISSSFENENSSHHHPKENINVKKTEPISSYTTTDQKLSESIPELEFISATASHIVRGLGDGFSTLAGVFQDVVNLNVNTNTENSMESKKFNFDAWDEEWGDNDGWDVDNTEIIETIPDSKVLETESGTGDKNSELSTKIHQSIHSDHSNQPENTQEENSIYSGIQKTLNVRSWDWNGVSSFAQQLTSSIQNTSLDIVQGGVDVLELIGRKTMSVLAENDPGFEYTKRFLRPPNLHNQPTLSKILREAHELHSNQISSDQSNLTKQKRGNFTHQLELNRALMHLEALELVSEQAQIQLNIRLESITSLSSDYNNNLNELKQLTTPNKGLLDQIWNNLQIEDEEEEEEGDSNFDSDVNENTVENDKLSKHMKAIQTTLSLKNKYLWSKFIRILHKLNSFYSYEQLVKTLIDLWNTTQSIQQNSPVEEIFFQSLSCLSQFTSAYLEYLHKFSECMLVRNQERNVDYVEVSKLLSEFFQFSLKLQLAFCYEYMKIMKNLSASLTDSNTCQSQSIPTSQSAGNLLVECGNAESYLKNASNLLVPIIQLTCVNSMTSS